MYTYFPGGELRGSNTHVYGIEWPGECEITHTVRYNNAKRWTNHIIPPY